jgi:pyrroline-5-carboxylate reductase
MHNIAIAIQQSITFYATDNASEENLLIVKEIFNTLLVSIKIQEGLVTYATALCGCGIAFFLPSVRADLRGVAEVGFHANDAKKIESQTAKG